MSLIKGSGPYTARELIRNALDNVPALPGSEPFNSVATEVLINQLIEYGYLNEEDV